MHAQINQNQDGTVVVSYTFYTMEEAQTFVRKNTTKQDIDEEFVDALSGEGIVIENWAPDKNMARLRMTFGEKQKNLVLQYDIKGKVAQFRVQIADNKLIARAGKIGLEKLIENIVGQAAPTLDEPDMNKSTGPLAKILVEAIQLGESPPKKKRKAGRPPKGKKWDENMGVYV